MNSTPAIMFVDDTPGTIEISVCGAPFQTIDYENAADLARKLGPSVTHDRGFIETVRTGPSATIEVPNASHGLWPITYRGI